MRAYLFTLVACAQFTLAADHAPDAPATQTPPPHAHAPDAHALDAPALDAHAPDAHASDAHTPPPTSAPKTGGHGEAEGVDAKTALQKLVDGNLRFTDANPQRPRADQDRRCITSSAGQHPFATVLSCADSRVPPEIIFDTGIGDLFVIRVAGNVADVDEIATMEYGSEHLGSNLIVVMGHSKCGAVTAVVEGAQVHGNLAGLLDNIVPAAAKAKAENPELKGKALVPIAVRENVMQGIKDILTHSPAIHELVSSGQVKIVGAVYDIHSGAVQFLGEHPDQTALLKTPASPKTEHASAPDTHSDPHAKPAPGHADPHAKPGKETQHADTAHEQHSSAAKPGSPGKPTKPVEPTPSVMQRFGPPVAFGVGTLALSGVLVAILRR